MTNYEEDTLNGYLTKKRVAEYKNYHTKSLSWENIDVDGAACIKKFF